MQDFLTTLYQEMDVEGYYTVVGPAAGPFKTHKLNDDLSEYLGQPNTYFRVCPVGAPPGKGRRGPASATAAMACVWLDVDCGEKESGKDYFPTKELAKKWIQATLPYSILVSSGGGWHVYCILESPIICSDAASLERARAVSQRFQQWAREQCPHALDSTQDLARVLRLPGTIHSGTGATVAVEQQTTMRLSVEQIEALPLRAPTLAPATSNEELDFVLDPNCQVDEDLIIQMLATNPLLAETYAGIRHPDDTSPSGWRFSMISFLSSAGLPIQTIVDFTIRFLIDRRKIPPERLKLDRPEIWATELRKCKAASVAEVVQKTDNLDNYSREDQIKAVATLMGFPEPGALLDIYRGARIATDNVVSNMRFTLQINNVFNEPVNVAIEDLTQRTACARAIFMATGVGLPVERGNAGARLAEQWRRAIELAWRIATVLEAEQSDTASQLLHALRTYIESTDSATSIDEAKETGRVFLDGDVYVVPSAQLASRAGLEFPELRSTKEMHSAAQQLAKIGVQKVSQKYRGVRMACYLVPASVVTNTEEV
jgi:hypothetical protein